MFFTFYCKNNNNDIDLILKQITKSQAEEQTQLSMLKNNDGSGYNITQQQMKGFIDDINKITEDRIDPYYGTHTVTYESDIDRISLEHHAKSREGFALGAIIASEWIIGKTGVFSMRDVLNL